MRLVMVDLVLGFHFDWVFDVMLPSSLSRTAPYALVASYTAFEM